METWLKENGDQVIHRKCRMIYSGNKDGRHGIAIILSLKLGCIVLLVQEKNERIIYINLKLEQDICLIPVYAPQAGRSTGERDDDSQRIINFSVVDGLSVMNIFYPHSPSQNWIW